MRSNQLSYVAVDIGMQGGVIVFSGCVGVNNPRLRRGRFQFSVFSFQTRATRGICSVRSAHGLSLISHAEGFSFPLTHIPDFPVTTSRAGVARLKTENALRLQRR